MHAGGYARIPELSAHARLITEALVRASVRRDELKGQKRVKGKPLVFVGAKGGSGTTTVASNFAVSLARESGQRVVLVDMNLQLGDAALTLGMKSPFSTLDALRNEARLDSELVSKLLAEHGSGLKVLAAPDDLVEPSLFQLSMKLASAVHMIKAQDDPGEPGVFQPTAHSVGKLIGILRDDFAWVVIDAGCHYGSYARQLLEGAERIYMVTQVSVTELRNCNRLIAAHFKGDRRLEVVFNRYGLHNGEIDEQSIATALMVPSIASNYKIPDDFHTVRNAQNSGVAVAMKDSAITRVLTQMARMACGKAAPEVKKKKFSVFSWQRGSERSEVPKGLGLVPRKRPRPRRVEPEERQNSSRHMEPLNFERAKSEIYRDLLSKIDLEKLSRMSPDKARVAVRSMILEIVDAGRVPFNAAEQEKIHADLLDEVFGLGPLEPLLRDPNISDILVNDKTKSTWSARPAGDDGRRSATTGICCRSSTASFRAWDAAWMSRRRWWTRACPTARA